MEYLVMPKRSVPVTVRRVVHVSLPQVVSSVNQVLANKGIARRASAESTFSSLDFDSLDLAECMILLEDLVGAELDLPSDRPIKRVRDLVYVQARRVQ